ncbi:MAG: YciI family protein [Sandaracinaceae bacterium]
MQYLLLIYENESNWVGLDEQKTGAIMGDYKSFTEDIIKSGHFKAGDALKPVATATSVRVKDGKTITTDGPFAETKEQLGGYYLIEAKDLDEATKIAARIPAAKTGTIEVRPILTY